MNLLIIIIHNNNNKNDNNLSKLMYTHAHTNTNYCVWWDILLALSTNSTYTVAYVIACIDVLILSISLSIQYILVIHTRIYF